MISGPPSERLAKISAAGVRRLTEITTSSTPCDHCASKYDDLLAKKSDIFHGTDALTIVYKSVNDLPAAETMVLSDDFHVKRVWAQYDK